MNDHIDHAGVDSNPIVFVQNGRVRTTSVDVAKYFGKRHANVMRSVRSILRIEPGLPELTFELGSYADEQGQRRAVYHMDRDGFALIAMGFTGPRALYFKLAYIRAFNGMEAALGGMANDNAPAHPLDRREFPDWPLDEMRAKVSVADLYRKAYGPLACQWIMMDMRFPIPPKNLVTLGRQLFLDAG